MPDKSIEIIQENFVEKYGPMLRIIDSEDDLDVLAAEPGYSHPIGLDYRALRYRTLLGYLYDLETDVTALFEIAEEVAVHDAQLASQLVQTRRDLKRAIRFMKFRTQLERFLPAPFPSEEPRLLRRVIVSCIPQRKWPSELLRSLNNLRDALRLSYRLSPDLQAGES